VRGRSNPAAAFAAALLFVVAAASCAKRPATTEIVAPGETDRTAASDRHARYRTDVAAISQAFDVALRLPPVEAAVVLFPNRRAFERGLVEIGYTERLARTASAFDAIGGARAVLVNAQVVDSYTRARRVRLLAHELVHTMQYRFGGGTRGASEQWLREGFAEWVACRVAAHLRLGSFDSLKDDVLAPLRQLPIGTAPMPLQDISTFAQWAEAQRRAPALYAQAFLGAELLVQQHGVPAVVRYFESFKTTKDRHRAFVEAFGLELRAFERVLAIRWYQTIGQLPTR
jgi:hypothetical protein